MMAMMILAVWQVYSCNTGTGLGMPWDASLPEAEICPVTPSGKTRLRVEEDSPDLDDWMKLPAVHCQATQSVLTFLCGSNGRSRKVKFGKFRHSCGIRAAACLEAVETGRLMVGKLEHTVIMNGTGSHLGGGEDCSQG